MGGGRHDTGPGDYSALPVCERVQESTERPCQLGGRDSRSNVSPHCTFNLKTGLSEYFSSPDQNSNGLFYNYADNSTTFYDTSSTALLASTVYRLSLLSNIRTYIPLAEQIRKALLASAGTIVSVTTTSTTPAPSTTSTALVATGTTTSGLLHFTPEGWLTPVVNPYSYGAQGSQSPEGQAFILELQAAWRDWVADGAQGVSSARKARPCAIIGAIIVLPWLMIVIS